MSTYNVITPLHLRGATMSKRAWHKPLAVSQPGKMAVCINMAKKLEEIQA